ncbi:MAG: tetratricopeptide repeat protein [Deltaproteobacteria bacterium]|nr:tetratricopeptide repeat protein [Deltaproteobacteria bacterium]
MRSGSARRSGVVFPVLLAALTIAFTVRPLDDFDVGYHLAAGRLMLATWQWPATNVLVFTTPDYPWADLHWLFQLMLYGAWVAAGPNGCILLALGLMLGTVGMLYATARRHAPPVLVALVLALALTIASPRLVPRPELVGFFFLAVFLWLLDRYPQSGRGIYAIVPLQAVWFNAHGTVPVGLGLIGCYWLAATLAFLPLPSGWRAMSRCTPVEWRRLTLVMVLATAVCLVNPWGIAGARLPFELLFGMSGGSVVAQWIGEFRPPFGVGLPVIVWTWVAMLLLTGASFLVNLRRWHLGQLFAVLVFGFLSTRVFRHIPLFAWTAVPAVAANLGAIWDGRTAPAPATKRFAPRLAEAAVAMGILLLVGAIVTNRFSRLANFENEFGFGISRLRFPAEAVAFGRQVGIAGRPFNSFNAGGYLAWELLPGQPVFIDGRMAAYPESFLRTYFGLFEDPRRWPEMAAQYRLDWALLLDYYPDHYALARYLASGHGWSLVYYDENASLYLPTDEAHRETRERAQRAFAELRQRRQAEPVTTDRSLWQRVAVPVEEVWRQFAYGDFLRVIGQNGEAVRAYQRALALDPDRAWTRYSLGLAYWSTGERSRAVSEWRDVLQRHPDFERARSALAEAARAGTQ